MQCILHLKFAHIVTTFGSPNVVECLITILAKVKIEGIHRIKHVPVSQEYVSALDQTDKVRPS